MAKEKKPEKTKEELLKEEHDKQEVKRQRAFVKNVFYPWLLVNCDTIADAKRNCYLAAITIQQAFNAQREEERQTAQQLGLTNLMLNEQPFWTKEEYAKMRGIIELVQDESITNAMSLIEGMHKVIESFEREEATKRKLDTLPATFLD